MYAIVVDWSGYARNCVMCIILYRLTCTHMCHAICSRYCLGVIRYSGSQVIYSVLCLRSAAHIQSIDWLSQYQCKYPKEMGETKMYHTIPKHKKAGNMGTIRGKHCTYMQELNELPSVQIMIWCMSDVKSLLILNSIQYWQILHKTFKICCQSLRYDCSNDSKAIVNSVRSVNPWTTGNAWVWT